MMNLNNPLSQYGNKGLVSEFIIPAVAPIKYIIEETADFKKLFWNLLS